MTAHGAPVELQCKLAVLWNSGTDGARTFHADATTMEAADANVGQ